MLKLGRSWCRAAGHVYVLQTAIVNSGRELANHEVAARIERSAAGKRSCAFASAYDFGPIIGKRRSLKSHTAANNSGSIGNQDLYPRHWLAPLDLEPLR